MIVCIILARRTVGVLSLIINDRSLFFFPFLFNCTQMTKDRSPNSKMEITKDHDTPSRVHSDGEKRYRMDSGNDLGRRSSRAVDFCFLGLWIQGFPFVLWFPPPPKFTYLVYLLLLVDAYLARTHVDEKEQASAED